MVKQGSRPRKERQRILFLVTIGPVLQKVLAAQATGFQSTEFPAVEKQAERLVALATELGHPVVWPVGNAAERLVGAAIVVAKGQLRARDWNSYVSGESVLLVCIAAATPLPLYAAADEARAFGAERVMACGVSVCEVSGGRTGLLDAYFSIDTKTERLSDDAALAV